LASSGIVIMIRMGVRGDDPITPWLRRDVRAADVRDQGAAVQNDVGSTLTNRRHRTPTSGPKSANNRLMRRNK
jgi:hypothetical protein